MTDLATKSAVSESTAPESKNAVSEPESTSSASERRVRIRAFTVDGLLTLFGAALGSLALTWLVYERILPLSGALGFWVLWYVLFLTLYGTVTAMIWGRRAVADRVITVVMISAGVFIVAVILDQIGYTAYRGSSALKHSNFLTSTMALTGPLDPLTSGGVLHAMVGSLEQMGIATAIAVPLGLLAALFMAEIGGPMARPVRSLVEAMTSLPEIVAGLFIFALLLLTFHLRPSGFAAALALTVMMIPFVARSSEVMLRLVPNNLREASYALGSSQWRTTLNVVLPTARSGLITGIVLGMARAIGETAPVLLTAGSSPYMNLNPFHGNQISLPLYIFVYEQRPDQQDKYRAFGAAVVLIAIVLILFTLARMLGGKAPGELTRRQRRRISRDLRDASGSQSTQEPPESHESPESHDPYKPHGTVSEGTAHAPA
jgi:phosphate transport system permease protein